MATSIADQPIYFRTLDPSIWQRGDRGGEEWQRARLFHGMTRVVAEKGYAKVTVADVVAVAGMSRRTFYQHFDDVEDCFVASYEAATSALLAEVEEAVRAAQLPDWHARFEVSITAYLNGLASDPYMARACLVDVLGAGPRAVETRRSVYARFVAQMRALRHPRGSERDEIPEIQFWAAVGAIGELVQDHIVGKGARTLPDLTPTLVHIGWALLERRFEPYHAQVEALEP
jgi:AcrR family transcriptional regulator